MKRPAVGIGGVVFDAGGRVLLVRRGTAPARGLWSVPGGKQEAGETMRAACRREIYEETGLDVSVGPIVAVVERMREGFHYVIIDFLATLRGPAVPTVVPSSDVSDVRWVSLDALDQFELVEGLTQVVKSAVTVREGLNRGLAGTTGRDYLAG